MNKLDTALVSTALCEAGFSLTDSIKAVLANDKLINGAESSVLTRADGLVLLSFFIIFIYYSLSIAKRIEGADDLLHVKAQTILNILVLIIIGLAALILGGKFIVDGAVKLAIYLGISQMTIGLTIVAVGTSLPELATSAVAAYKKNFDIAIGNIVGSNIFNIFFILGISSLIRPLPFQPGSNFDIGLLVLANILLFIFMFTGKKHKLDRWEAILFLGIYAVYIFTLIFLR
jgi:cation:H+ antiporter